jgi:hypothetical protein
MAKSKNKIEVYVYEGNELLSVEEAKTYLGWEEEPEGADWKDKFFMKVGATKVRLNNNPSNRPYRRAIAMRYANEILRKKWRLNGETIIIDDKGNTQSGQHRLIGLVMAEELRKKQAEKWRDRYHNNRPISIPAIIVTGVDSSKDVVDTIDIGVSRTLSDVMFRNQVASTGSQTKDRAAKTVAKVLSHATRLLWLRLGGKKVSDAPHFPHSEALEVNKQHPALLAAVEKIIALDSLEEGRRLSAMMSLGTASALLYLMSASETDAGVYRDAEGEYAPDLSMTEEAEGFWSLVASGEGLVKGDPILALRGWITRHKAGSGAERDELIAAVIKAWNFHTAKDNKEVSIADLNVKKSRAKNGKSVPVEEPRMGGLDQVGVIVEEEAVALEAAAEIAA